MLDFTIMILAVSIVVSFLHQVYITTISNFTYLSNGMTSSWSTHLPRLLIHEKDISLQPQCWDIVCPQLSKRIDLPIVNIPITFPPRNLKMLLKVWLHHECCWCKWRIPMYAPVWRVCLQCFCWKLTIPTLARQKTISLT